MDFYTYIIYSSSKDCYYVGQTQDLEKRMNDHCNGRSGYTKGTRDWTLKWSKEFPTRSDAIKMERKIKLKKSRKYIEYLIGAG